jgi:hypothetical protein
MLLIGADHLASQVGAKAWSLKMVFNERGAILLPVDRQHREMKATGISYEDDYRGDALAAMLSPGRIEIRYHKDFSDRKVARIIGALLQQPELPSLRAARVTYQGRELRVEGVQ